MPPTLLIAHHSPAVLETLNLLLSAEGDPMLFAATGPTALELARAHRPDLILLEAALPEDDGYTICARLKADPRTRAIPVLLIIPREAGDETRGLEAGAADYVSTPFHPAVLRARVRAHLELKRQREFLDNLSATDGLTGLANRRRCDEFVEQEWQRALRNQTPLSLILANVDFFHAYNEHYGHLAGDDCLRRVGQLLREVLRRPADLAGRYAGDTFACVLPETDAAGAEWVAAQAREQMAALGLPHALSTVAEHVTLSLGVATLLPLTGQPATELVALAEANLRTAKRR